MLNIGKYAIIVPYVKYNSNSLIYTSRKKSISKNTF